MSEGRLLTRTDQLHNRSNTSARVTLMVLQRSPVAGSVCGQHFKTWSNLTGGIPIGGSATWLQTHMLYTLRMHSMRNECLAGPSGQHCHLALTLSADTGRPHYRAPATYGVPRSLTRTRVHPGVNGPPSQDQAHPKHTPKFWCA